MNVKQYLRLIKIFCSGHGQINTVKSGNKFNFNAKSDIVYPIAHIEYINHRTTPDVRSFYFLITVADLYDINLEDSEEDIFSDCTEICDDILDYFDGFINDVYTINSNTTIDTWDNGHIDQLRGATFVLTFNETRLVNTCLIPHIQTSSQE